MILENLKQKFWKTDFLNSYINFIIASDGRGRVNNGIAVEESVKKNDIC